jgi:hypothetical protein
MLIPQLDHDETSQTSCIFVINFTFLIFRPPSDVSVYWILIRNCRSGQLIW